MKGVRLDTEELRGILLVAVRFLEDVEDDLPFDPFQEFFQADGMIQAVLMDVQVEKLIGHPAVSGVDPRRSGEWLDFHGFIPYHRRSLSSLPEQLKHVQNMGS